MSVDNKIIFSYEKKKIKPLKLNYNQITPKRVNLCKKYFYMDQPKDKINLIKFNNEKNALEQVDNVITKLTRKRTDLDITKIDCIKSMILSNKNIPEKWIMRPGYKDLLNIAMKDDIVLNYAINCKDIYKKKAGYDKDDDTRYEEYMKSLPPEKKFISYINPHTQNYKDSNKKKILMKEYDKKYFKKFYKFPIINTNNSRQRGDSAKNNNKENIKKNKLIGINYSYNLTEGNDTRNDLMVTSLHYTGLDSNDENNKNKNLELKLPEISMI
jgi:hypothetical protein